MQRVRARNPGVQSFTRDELCRAIMLECGTSPMTYYNNRNALIKLGWIETRKRRFRLTDLDLTEDFL
jgi:hypothetical protein